MSRNSDLTVWINFLLVVGEASCVSFNQPQFSPCASWTSDAITFANYNVSGSSPVTVFVDTNNTVYVTLANRNQVLVWLEGSGTITRNICAGLMNPWGLFVTDNGDIYVDNESPNKRVDKWVLNATNSVAVMNTTGQCYSLFVDINNTLYCSTNGKSTVVKMSLNSGSNIVTVAAGNGTIGRGPYMLNEPNGIFVDDEFTLYVADCGNSRVQLFKPGELSGSTVQVSGIYGSLTLHCPTAVWLDGNGYLFIVELGRNRILGSGPTGFRCLVGCSETSGSASYQFNSPRSLAFDSYGNMFVADTNNGRIQKFFLATNSCDVSYNQPKFSSCASWNPNATTFENISTILRKPHGVFVTTNNMVYATITNLSEVLLWSATGNAPMQTFSSGLSQPYGLFITNDGSMYVDNGVINHQVNKWLWNGTSLVTVKNINSTCFALFIDMNDTLYCSIYREHKVIKVSLNNSSNIIIIAAGNGTVGSTPYMLDSPKGIFVDEYFNLYVADYGNDRIQLFQFGQLNGTTIAGNETIETILLNGPTGIILDADNYLFIVDSNNNRIIASGSTGFQCLVGCSGIQGSGSDQLNQPQSISFDSYGNIFVTDMNNNRIQKFLLASNSCDITTVVTTDDTTSTHTIQVQQPSHIFVPPTCSSSTNIGINCSISSTACAMLKPCQNNGICINTNNTYNGYICSCPPGFNGTQCQFDHRACKTNTCWNNGICNETSMTTFICLCESGWNGIYCEIQIDYCQNITCNNNGICRSLFLNYTCECFGTSYTGRNCQITSKKTIVYQTVSKTVSYIAIIALISVAMFIVILDLLKYCFGVDVTKVESKEIQKKKQRIKRKPPVIIRFVYVNPPEPIPFRKAISTIQEAVV